LVDLTVAIEIGIIVAAFLFMRKMMQSSSVQQTILAPDQLSDDEFNQSVIPKGVDVFEINGPLFFGAAYKFKDTMKVLEKPARVLIIRMRNVPVIDATGIRVLRDVHQEIKKKGTKLILSEANSEQVTGALKKTRLLFQIGKGNVRDTFEKALKRADEVLLDTDPSKKSYAG
jgi:SulP family sulfate permease